MLQRPCVRNIRRSPGVASTGTNVVDGDDLGTLKCDENLRPTADEREPDLAIGSWAAWGLGEDEAQDCCRDCRPSAEEPPFRAYGKAVELRQGAALEPDSESTAKAHSDRDPWSAVVPTRAIRIATLVDRPIIATLVGRRIIATVSS